MNENDEISITAKDLFLIISLAKDQYKLLPNGLHISGKLVEENDFKHIALANAVIMWLNRNGALKKLAKFDYTDHSAQYEESE